MGKVPAVSPWQTTSSALYPHLQSVEVHFDSRWRRIEGQGVIRGHWDITGLARVLVVFVCCIWIFNRSGAQFTYNEFSFVRSANVLDYDTVSLLNVFCVKGRFFSKELAWQSKSFQSTCLNSTNEQAPFALFSLETCKLASFGIFMCCGLICMPKL